MDAKGRSIDNIVIFQTLLRNSALLHERFWRTIKYENIYPSSYKNIKEARNGIKEYIDTYNKERLHSALNYLTPDEVYFKELNNSCYNTNKLLPKVA